MWAVFMKFENRQYKIIKSGLNLIVDDNYDKIIITNEQIARQIEKFSYIDGQLLIRPGEIMLTIDELNNKSKGINQEGTRWM